MGGKIAGVMLAMLMPKTRKSDADHRVMLLYRGSCALRHAEDRKNNAG